MCEKSHYQVLEVVPVATLEEIKTAYREKAMLLHPDIVGENGDFLAVRDAYKVLSDNEERRKYDMVISLMWDGCEHCKGAGVTYKQKGFTYRIKVLCTSCLGKGHFPRRKK